MERSTKLKYGIVILLFLILIFTVIAVVLAYFLFFTSQAQAFDGRPVVLVHKPLNNAQIPLGERVFVHAKARAEDGIQRVELWVDNQLVDSKESPLSASRNPLVLAAGWAPTTLGRHIIVVQGISAGGVQGQATIYVYAVEPEPEIGTHTVGEGETFESIADDYGISEDELHDLNPDLDTDRIEEGDSVDVPGGGAGPGGPDRADDEPPDGDDDSSRDDDASPEGDGGDEVPPDPHADDPSEPEDLSGLIDIVDGEDSVQLVVEVLALETDSAYEGVHCFAAFASGTHQRYPEGDGSFATLTGESWEIASMLSGPAAPIISWSPDQAFEIDITCIGISSGGTEAVDLGNLLITVMPVAWDSVTRRAVSPGEEGHFTLDYRVSYALQEAFGDKDIDPRMASPTNVHTVYVWGGSGDIGLSWDYTPNPEEPPISGFIIYMNGNLMWTVGADQVFTNLPPEWLRPPCGDSYAFEVSAYRNELPAGPESYPSEPPAVIAGPEPGSDGCVREVVVVFDKLTTYELAGDGRYDPGDMGPVYGDFYAGDQNRHFDGRCGRGSICSETSLNHDSEYDINAILSYTSGASSTIIVTVPEGEGLEIGYDITDADTGRNNADDPVCGGGFTRQYDLLDEPFEAEIMSENGRCSVSIHTWLSPESPVGEPGGGPPLPWLVVEDISLAPGSTTHPEIIVRNDGDASWPQVDLVIDVTNRAGEPYGRFTWYDRWIPPGATISLTESGLHPEPPLDICVMIDPDDQVLEKPESTGAAYHHQVCTDLPDLRIIDAQYNRAANQLNVTVENASDIPVEGRDIEMFMEFADGGVLRPAAWSDVSIRPWGTTDIVWVGTQITPDERQSMLGGYTLIVDPRDRIAEEDEDNNRYTVPISQQVQVSWLSFTPPYIVEGDRHRAKAHIIVDVVGGTGSQRMLDAWTPELEYRPEFSRDVRIWNAGTAYGDFGTPYFDLAGDERIAINFETEFRLRTRHFDIGQLGAVFGLRDLQVFRPSGYDECGRMTSAGGEGSHIFTYSPTGNFGTLGLSHRPYWSVRIGLCYLEE